MLNRASPFPQGKELTGRISVLRLCFSSSKLDLGMAFPDHLDPQSLLMRPEAISWRDVSERGFSLQRIDSFTTQQFRRDTASKLQAKPHQTLVGFVATTTVRALSAVSSHYVVRSYDEPDNPGHTALVIRTDLVRESAHKKHRVEIAKAFHKAFDPRLICGPPRLNGFLISVCRALGLGRPKKSPG